MSKIVVVENLSLDGVMQAPGRADEDLRGGFAHGGWAMPYDDSAKGAFAALRLVDAQTTTTGVVIATYRQAEQPARARHAVRYDVAVNVQENTR